MSTLLRWLWLGLWRLQRGRAATAVAAVAIGVSLGLAIHLVHASALDEFGRALAVVNGDAQAQLVATTDRFDETLYGTLATDPRIEAASPVLDVEVPVAQTARDGPPAVLRIVGLDVFAAARVTPSLLPSIEGADDGTALFADDAVFLSSAALRKVGRAVGQTLELRTGLGTVSLRIAGEVRGAAAGQAIGVMDLGALQWRLDRIGSLSRIDLRLAAGADLGALGDDLARRAGGSARLVTPDRSEQRMSNLSRAYRVNLNVLSLVALFTGGFIVYSTLALAIARQRPALAILGVLGAPPRLTTVFVLGQGAILGVAGALLGVLLGIALAYAMLTLSGGDLGGGYFRGETPTLTLEPGGILLYASGGLLAGIAGALQPAWTARHLAPARALKGAVPVGGRAHRFGWPLAFAAAGALLLALPPIDELPFPAYLAIAAWLLAGIAAVPAIVGLAGPRARADGGDARAAPAAVAGRPAPGLAGQRRVRRAGRRRRQLRAGQRDGGDGGQLQAVGRPVARRGAAGRPVRAGRQPRRRGRARSRAAGAARRDRRAGAGRVPAGSRVLARSRPPGGRAARPPHRPGRSRQPPADDRQRARGADRRGAGLRQRGDGGPLWLVARPQRGTADGSRTAGAARHGGRCLARLCAAVRRGGRRRRGVSRGQRRRQRLRHQRLAGARHDGRAGAGPHPAVGAGTGRTRLAQRRRDPRDLAAHLRPQLRGDLRTGGNRAGGGVCSA